MTLHNAEIRLRGRVQGVGMRPMVWRLAQELGLSGEVLNDAAGVVIRASGQETTVADFVHRLRAEAPSLARIETIETRLLDRGFSGGFRIVDTQAGRARTEVPPDVATCPACADEILDPANRRYRYPFTTCTQCGPRLSIVTGIPYDRLATTMAAFGLCLACAREYHNPSDRRFHAEAIACPACGPKLRLVALEGWRLEAPAAADPLAAAACLVLAGGIVAVKGLGGYQLACDATNARAVVRLRGAKQRDAKPFALMARDLHAIRRYCRPTMAEELLLESAAAPIVLMEHAGSDRLPEAVAPGVETLGFMLPTTPLHLLLLGDVDRPVVMTSGNLSDRPQVTDDQAAMTTFAGVADAVLVHDRDIANRVDDSVIRIAAAQPRLLRRARGFAPAALKLPDGFDDAADVLALGGELKSTFCLLSNSTAVLSPHQGDLEDADTFDDFKRQLALYAEVFNHSAACLAADRHPDYLSAKLARRRAAESGLPLFEVQHHHAHVASCLAENCRPRSAPPVLGIVLDGLGWGEDGTIWGGEFLLADYERSTRLATFRPVAMPGGAQAACEPWRNLYAHLMAGMGWTELKRDFAMLDLIDFFAAKPRRLLDQAIANSINSPLASSCGRLFDAVAAAVGLCRDAQAYEGQAAARLEAIVDRAALVGESDALAYHFALGDWPDHGLSYIEPLPMWRALLRNVREGTPAGLIAARFHKGLARAIAAMAARLAQAGAGFDTIALSGGCFQNAILLEQTLWRLEAEGFTVLSHRDIPCNDGGLSLGQAVIGAARHRAADR
jgi:hydrogenase maturation protein HypF